MEILLLKPSLVLGLTMYYFFIELLAMIPLPPYSYLRRGWPAVSQVNVHEMQRFRIFMWIEPRQPSPSGLVVAKRDPRPQPVSLLLPAHQRSLT